MDFVRTPRKVKELVRKVSRAYEQLKLAGEEDITPEMIAEALNIEQEKVLDVMSIPATKQLISLEQLSSFDEEDLSLIEKVSNDDSDDFLMDYDNRSILQDAFDALPEDMKKIIQMSFYEDFSQREIAEIMGVSQMQISRLIKRALLLMYESIVKRI